MFPADENRQHRHTQVPHHQQGQHPPHSAVLSEATPKRTGLDGSNVWPAGHVELSRAEQSAPGSSRPFPGEAECTSGDGKRWSLWLHFLLDGTTSTVADAPRRRGSLGPRVLVGTALASVALLVMSSTAFAAVHSGPRLAKTTVTFDTPTTAKPGTVWTLNLWQHGSLLASASGTSGTLTVKVPATIHGSVQADVRRNARWYSGNRFQVSPGSGTGGKGGGGKGGGGSKGGGGNGNSGSGSTPPLVAAGGPSPSPRWRGQRRRSPTDRRPPSP